MRRIVVVMATAAIGLTACGGGSDNGTIDTTVPAARGTTTIGATTTTVADGRVRAYLKTLDTATRLLTYASVDNPAVYAVAIAPDAAVTLNVLADGSATDRPATLAQLKDGLAKDGSENIPFWLTIKGGTITKIEEQFVP